MCLALKGTHKDKDCRPTIYLIGTASLLALPSATGMWYLQSTEDASLQASQVLVLTKQFNNQPRRLFSHNLGFCISAAYLILEQTWHIIFLKTTKIFRWQHYWFPYVTSVCMLFLYLSSSKVCSDFLGMWFSWVCTF